MLCIYACMQDDHLQVVGQMCALIFELSISTCNAKYFQPAGPACIDTVVSLFHFVVVFLLLIFFSIC